GATAADAAGGRPGGRWRRRGDGRLGRRRACLGCLGIVLGTNPGGMRAAAAGDGRLAARRQPRGERVGSLVRNRLRHRRRDRRPGILRAATRRHLLAGDAVDALAGRIGDIPDVGDFGSLLVLGGDDVAAQGVIDALVLGGGNADALFFDGAGEFLLDLFGDGVGCADDGCDHHLGQWRLLWNGRRRGWFRGCRRILGG